MAMSSKIGSQLRAHLTDIVIDEIAVKPYYDTAEWAEWRIEDRTG